MGVSENSVPLNPMVLLIIIPMKNGYFIGKINPTFSGPNPYGHSPDSRVSKKWVVHPLSPGFLLPEAFSKTRWGRWGDSIC